jgi:hypothetical protein
MPNRKALVVAIDDYGGPPNNLPSCIADGNAISRFLQASYNIRDVHTLFDAKATAANVERELDWLVADAKPDDRLVFFYSGHGYTKLTNGVMEEFLVLRDESGKPALWLDDKLVAKTQNLPTGALTVLLDCCFAGGAFKFVLDPTDATADAEIAQVKAYQPPPEEQAKAFEPLVARKPEEGRPVRLSGYRRFGCGTSLSTRALSTALAHATAGGVARAVAPKALSDPSEGTQPEMNALLVSACLETETAAASTSKTGGLSAFTHCMLKAVQALGNRRTASDVFNRTAANLKTLGFRQTPLILERARPGTLKNRTFVDMEVRKVADEMSASAFASGSSVSATEEDMEKFLPLLGAILPAVISAAPSIIGAIRPRRKAFELGESGGTEQEEMQKFLPFIASAVSAALPAILQAVRGRRKDIELGAEAGLGADVSDEDMQKFLPLLGAILPAVISAAPGIIGAIRPRRKAFELGAEAFGGSEQEEMQKFLPLIAGAVSAALPAILQAVRGRRKDLELGGEAGTGVEFGDEDIQKFLPLLGAILPAVISSVPGIVRSIGGRRKEFSPFESAETGLEGDEKIFGAVLRVLPHVLRAAPGILQTFAPRKGFDLGGETMAEGDEKIFGAILRVLPRVLQAAPGIVQAFAPQKGFDLGSTAGGGAMSEGDEKIFGAILRALPRILQAGPALVQAFQPQQQQKGFDIGSAGGGAMSEGDEKIFGAILRVLPRVLQAAPGIAQAIASGGR